MVHEWWIKRNTSRPRQPTNENTHIVGLVRFKLARFTAVSGRFTQPSATSLMLCELLQRCHL